jgi:hypothetical protein
VTVAKSTLAPVSATETVQTALHTMDIDMDVGITASITPRDVCSAATATVVV